MWTYFTKLIASRILNLINLILS